MWPTLFGVGKPSVRMADWFPDFIAKLVWSLNLDCVLVSRRQPSVGHTTLKLSLSRVQIDGGKKDEKVHVKFQMYDLDSSSAFSDEVRLRKVSLGAKGNATHLHIFSRLMERAKVLRGWIQDFKSVSVDKFLQSTSFPRQHMANLSDFDARFQFHSLIFRLWKPSDCIRMAI